MRLRRPHGLADTGDRLPEMEAPDKARLDAPKPRIHRTRASVGAGRDGMILPAMRPPIEWGGK